jgi:hypothetical protein
MLEDFNELEKLSESDAERISVSERDAEAFESMKVMQ